MKKIGLKHLNYLTDDFGIWQHTNGKRIDRQHGYALDDSARALLVATKMKLDYQSDTYINFLDIATRDQKIINFFGPNKKPLSLPWSEDALGEAYWALSDSIKKEQGTGAQKIVKKITPLVEKFTSLRGRAYSLIGACGQNEALSRKLFRTIEADFKAYRRSNWTWLENRLSYANAIIPLSILEYAKTYHCESAKMIGFSLLDFLNRATKLSSTPIVIGNQGWFARGCKKAIFDQQPIDAAYQVLANIKAYEISFDGSYLDEAICYFSWFWGNNVKNLKLVNTLSEGCYDGIREDGLSKNMGAESIVCYLLAQETIWPYIEGGGKEKAERRE